MINFAHNFLFCHNEKTAGTSITQHLRKVKGNYYVTSNLFEPNLASLECGVLDDNVGNELGHYPNQHIALNVWANFIELGDYFTFGFVRAFNGGSNTIQFPIIVHGVKFGVHIR